MDTLQAAREDFADVVELTRELIRVPSRGGIDPYDPVLGVMASMAGPAWPGVPSAGRTWRFCGGR